DWLLNLLKHEAFRGAIITVGVIVAVISVLTARSTARKKQVADMLFASRGDEKLQRGCLVVKALHDDPTRNLRTMVDDPEQKEELRDVFYLLIHFETVCVGIKNGIYDEKMVKDAWCTMMIDSYSYSLPVIESVRKRHQKDTIYQEF